MIVKHINGENWHMHATIKKSTTGALHDLAQLVWTETGSNLFLFKKKINFIKILLIAHFAFHYLIKHLNR